MAQGRLLIKELIPRLEGHKGDVFVQTKTLDGSTHYVYTNRLMLIRSLGNQFPSDTYAPWYARIQGDILFLDGHLRDGWD